METKHTPTPWRVRDDGKAWAIIGAEPSWIGDIDKRNHGAEANAAFIVRAVNSHDELLKLLRECGDEFQTHFGEDFLESDLGNRLRAAILKARGEA